jgi:hypothetical protein
LSRKYPDIVRKGFYASEPESLVANPFTDLFGTCRQIPDSLYILFSKTGTTVCDVEDTFSLAVDNEPNRDPALFVTRVRVVGVLDKFVQNPIAIFSANNFVEVLKALVDFFAPLRRVDRIFKN